MLASLMSCTGSSSFSGTSSKQVPSPSSKRFELPLLQSEEGHSERRLNVRRITVFVLLVVGPFPLLSQAVADETSEKVTEHSLDSAKRANLMLSEIEQGWCKVAEGLIKNRANLSTVDGTGSIRYQASHQLGSAKKMVSDYKRLVSDL